MRRIYSQCSVDSLLSTVQTTTMAPTVAEDENGSSTSSDASAAMSDDKEQDEVSNKHVLRQAQLSRELQQLNAMLADKQELAGQMMRNDKQLESVKLQYEVSTLYCLGYCGCLSVKLQYEVSSLYCLGYCGCLSVKLQHEVSTLYCLGY